MNVGHAVHGFPILMPGQGDRLPVPDPTEHMTVRFEGLEAGVEELTWGQRSIWGAMTRQRSWMPLGGWKPLEPGVSAEDVADELRYLMTRYPSMRTRFRFDEAGRPTQELLGSGEISLEIYDVGADGDAPDQLAAAVEAHYRCTSFDMANHWPIRMAVIRRRGEPTHMVVIVCHLATDGGGARVMMREAATRTSTPPTGIQQLEQACWQRSAAGLRQNERALRHHEGILRTLPARRAPDSSDPRSPRYWHGEFRSRALQSAARVVEQRTGTASSPVLLALFAVALARVTGNNPVVIRPLVGNRFRPGLADVVCMLALPGICLLDVMDVTVDEAVARAQRATMSAYKHGYYDPLQLAELIDRISLERGSDLDVAYMFNDRREERREEPTVVPVTAAELHTARDDSTFRWVERTNRSSERVFLSIDDAPEGLLLTLAADTHFFPPAHFESLTRCIEDVAVAAALDPATSTSVTTSV